MVSLNGQISKVSNVSDPVLHKDLKQIPDSMNSSKSVETTEKMSRKSTNQLVATFIVETNFSSSDSP